MTALMYAETCSLSDRGRAELRFLAAKKGMVVDVGGKDLNENSVIMSEVADGLQ